MRRAFLVAAVAVATLLAAAWPVAGTPTHAVGSVPKPSPTDRADRIDFNGDGFDDLAIGVPSEGVGGAAFAGAVNVVYGSPGGLAGTNQVLIQANPEAGDLFGFAVAKGDFNADGFTDLAVGAPHEDVGGVVLAGAVNVFYGSAAGLPASSQVRLQANPEDSDQFGFALDAGLFNDDNVMDLAVGAPGETVGGRRGAGAVSVFYGSAAGLPATSQTLLQGNPEPGDNFGAALVAGFFNADQGDLAVGAPREDVGSAGGAGAVNVFYGTPAGLPAKPSSRAPGSVAPPRQATTSARRWRPGHWTRALRTWPSAPRLRTWAPRPTPARSTSSTARPRGCRAQGGSCSPKPAPE